MFIYHLTFILGIVLNTYPVLVYLILKTPYYFAYFTDEEIEGLNNLQGYTMKQDWNMGILPLECSRAHCATCGVSQ